MSKKVIGAFLALIMVLSVFSLSALAVGQYDWEADAGKYKQTWGLADGGNGVVQVTLTTDYEVGPISFVIEGVTLEDVNIGNGYYGGNASIDFNKTTGLVLIYPNTGADLKAQELNNAVVATFTYTGNATPAIKNNPKQNTADRMNGTLIAARCSGDYVNGSDYYVGQTCEILAFGQAPKPTEAADLALKSGVTGVVIDTSKTFGNAYAGAVYGLPVADGAKLAIDGNTFYTAILEATNGGSLEVTKSIYSGRKAVWGTGTEITVKNADGTVAKKYVAIVFGDVDGDGAIGTSDVGIVNESKVVDLPDVKKLAANCYVKVRGKDDLVAKSLYDVGTDDLGEVSGHSILFNVCDQVNIATMHSKENYKGYYYK